MSAYFESLNRRAGKSSAPRLVEAQSPRKRSSAQVRRVTQTEMPKEYAALREKLLMATPEKPPRVLVFSGCTGGEGCTGIVREFGEALAASGLNVLLVDVDLRSPRRSEPSRAAGNDGSVETQLGRGRLTTVPMPMSPGGKERLLATGELAAWMDEQRKRGHDLIILDAPPLLRFAEATILGRLCDGVILVVRAEVTARESLVQAREQLQRAGVKIVGAVLRRSRSPVPGFLGRMVTLE